MKFEINQQILNNLINICIKAINNKNIPILSCFYLEVIDNKLKIIGTDSFTTIEKETEVKSEKNGKIVVPARIFSEIIRKIGSSLINIEYLEKDNSINIKSNKIKFNVKCLNVLDYPLLEKDNFTKQFKLNSNLLKEMISHTIFAVSKDENRKALTGINLDIQNNEITMAALDLYRIAVIKKQIELNENLNITIRGDSLSELSKILSSYNDMDIDIEVSNNFIMFKIDNLSFISRLIDDKFLDYKRAIPDKYKIELIINNLNFYNAIDRVSLMCNEEIKNSIIMDIENNEIVISSQANKGDAKENIECEKNGNDVKIAFNPQFILEALKVIDETNIELKIIDSINPCLIQAKNNKDFMYMLLPIRI